MLKNTKLLIDQDCPMCNFYGDCFTKAGLIDEQTLSPYQQVGNGYAGKIDMHRAKNEIALLDIATNETRYGIDAFIEIVAHNHQWLRSVLRAKPIYWLLKRLYKFISYNRKVIYPSPHNSDARICCNPDFNITYRWAFIIFVALFTSVIVNAFAVHVNPFFGFKDIWWREYVICFGQVAWQSTAIFLISKPQFHDYLGNMSSVALIGGLLLLPVLGLQTLFALPEPVLIGAFASVLVFMLLDHIRRCKLLGLPLSMSASWVAYRAFVLALIFIPIIL